MLEQNKVPGDRRISKGSLIQGDVGWWKWDGKMYAHGRLVRVAIASGVIRPSLHVEVVASLGQAIGKVEVNNLGLRTGSGGGGKTDIGTVRSPTPDINLARGPTIDRVIVGTNGHQETGVPIEGRGINNRHRDRRSRGNASTRTHGETGDGDLGEAAKEGATRRNKANKVCLNLNRFGDFFRLPI